MDIHGAMPGPFQKSRRGLGTRRDPGPQSLHLQVETLKCSGENASLPRPAVQPAVCRFSNEGSAAVSGGLLETFRPAVYVHVYFNRKGNTFRL